MRIIVACLAGLVMFGADALDALSALDRELFNASQTAGDKLDANALPSPASAEFIPLLAANDLTSPPGSAA